MKHLSQEELIEHFYSEDEDTAATALHLDECHECSVALAELQNDLSDLQISASPARDENYGEQVWHRLSASLVPYSSKPSPIPSLGHRFNPWRSLGYAAACALLICGAFFSGRMWEQRHQPVITATAKPTPPPVIKQRVVVVVLGDHLDRSERLLVELKHADSNSDELVAPLRDEARSLLAANQICRENAEKAGNPDLEKALNHLDRVLHQLAKQPGGVNAASIARLQKEMNVNGLLFEVRVLRSRIPSAHPRSQGGTI
jgi:hypothetical protein